MIIKPYRNENILDLAFPSTYDSFSFPTNKLGYSGVGSYTCVPTARPSKAEEGLTGTTQPTSNRPLSSRLEHPNISA
jgi:hypothetical protein